MEQQADTAQGATDEQKPEATQINVGGEQGSTEPDGAGAQAANDQAVQAEPAAEAQGAEEKPAVTGDGSGQALPPVDDSGVEKTGAAIDPGVTILDRMTAKIAAIKVTMRTPEDGTNNPFLSYSAAAGEEVTVQAQHTAYLLDAGWKIVVDGWEEGHFELRAQRALLESIPGALRSMTTQELHDLGESIGKALA